MKPIIVDTGPLVALINGKDRYHVWAKTFFARTQLPLLSCEAVFTEACFLLQRFEGGESAILQLLERQKVKISLDLEEEVAAINRLMQRYRSVPMSLADACLVRLTELYEDSPVLTLDSDFQIYRKHSNKVITVLQPESED